MLNGFPSVGTRQHYHYVLLSIRRVMGWDDRELVEVFKEILERSAGRYRCTYEEAVDDFVSHVKASRNAGGVRMPDLTGQALPGDAGDRIVSYLGKRAGRDAGRVARLVTGYLWEKALVNPSMAWRGELGIKAVEMRAVVGARYWPSVKRVMAEENLLVETRECIPNRRTRRYMVNLPLLLWIVWGGRQHELRWELASRKAACERRRGPQRAAA